MSKELTFLSKESSDSVLDFNKFRKLLQKQFCLVKTFNGRKKIVDRRPLSFFRTFQSLCLRHGVNPCTDGIRILVAATIRGALLHVPSLPSDEHPNKFLPRGKKWCLRNRGEFELLQYIMDRKNGRLCDEIPNITVLHCAICNQIHTREEDVQLFAMPEETSCRYTPMKVAAYMGRLNLVRYFLGFVEDVHVLEQTHQHDGENIRETLVNGKKDLRKVNEWTKQGFLDEDFDEAIRHIDKKREQLKAGGGGGGKKILFKPRKKWIPPHHRIIQDPEIIPDVRRSFLSKNVQS